MKPTYHNVRPLSVTNQVQRIVSIERKISKLNEFINADKVGKESKVLMKARRVELSKERAIQENKLNRLKRKFKLVHDFS